MTKTLCISAVLFALSACSTQEIDPTPLVFARWTPGPDVGGLLIVFAPTDGYDPAHPNNTSYRGLVDGKQPVFDLDGSPGLIAIGEGAMTSLGYFAAGLHHFSIAAIGGGPTIFAGDGEIRAGALTRLYLFGPSDAIQGRFVSYPATPAPGTLHVSAINLVPDSPGIEVVIWGTATATTTSVSPPLARGETFDADFPSAGLTSASPEGRYWLSSGDRLWYRQVATAAAPSPALEPIPPGFFLQDHSAASFEPQPANLVAVPLEMTAQGEVISRF